LLKRKSAVGVPVGGLLMSGRGYKCVANLVLKEMISGFYPPPMDNNCVFADQESAIIAEKLCKKLTQSKKVNSIFALTILRE
jgi:hypothetical protein